ARAPARGRRGPGDRLFMRMALADAQLEITLRRRDPGQLDAADVTGGLRAALVGPAAGAGHGDEQSGRHDRSEGEALAAYVEPHGGSRMVPAALPRDITPTGRNAALEELRRPGLTRGAEELVRTRDGSSLELFEPACPLA